MFLLLATCFAGLRITLLHTLRTSSIFSLLISALDGARHLLEQNNEVLRHISANLSVFKVNQSPIVQNWICLTPLEKG